MEEQGLGLNTVFVRNTTLTLFLSRLLVLRYCLQVPNCHQTWKIITVLNKNQEKKECESDADPQTAS
jgi:hypothetical protein